MGAVSNDIDKMREVLKMLDAKAPAGYKKYLSIKLLATVAATIFLVVAFRHEVGTIIWSLTTLWSVFLVTRTLHDIAIERRASEAYQSRAHVRINLIDALVKTNQFTPAVADALQEAAKTEE